MTDNNELRSIPCELLEFEEYPTQLQFLSQVNNDASSSAYSKNFSVLVPPLAIPCNTNQYSIISGMKDVLVAMQEGCGMLTCRVLAVDTPVYERFTLQVLHLQLQQPSIVEQSYLLNKARKHLSEQELCSMLPLMGFKPQKFKVENMLQLMELDALTLQALHIGEVSLKTVSKLSPLNDEDRHQIISLIQSYRLGGSKQLKLADMAVELLKREQTSFSHLLNDWYENTEIKDKENRPQQAATLLSYLYRRCHPQLTAEEDDFNRWILSLQLPESTKITHSQAFEDETVELNIRFANKDSLRTCWNKIHQIVPAKELKEH